jgi:hypothetical protein
MTPPFGARNELSIPEKVRGDKSAAELIRAWVTANGDVHVTIKTDVWQDPAAYGIVLADLARHCQWVQSIPRQRCRRRIAAGC